MEISKGTHPVIKVISASDIQEYRREERKKSVIDSFLTIGAAGAGLAAASYGIRKADINPNVLKFLNAGMNPRSDQTVWSDLKGSKYKSASLGDFVLEGLRRAEELSPLKIIRTLQLSHLFTPFMLGNAAEMIISREDISAQRKYFTNLLGDNFDQSKIRYGLKLEGGQLFYLNREGLKDGIALNHARMVSAAHMSGGGDSARNKVFEHLRHIQGVKEEVDLRPFVRGTKSPFTVYGTSSALRTNVDMGRALGRYMFHRGMEVFDKPFAEMTQLLPWKDSKSTKLVKDITTINLGTGGDYTTSVPKGMLLSAKNLIKKGVGGAILYSLADKALRDYMPEDNAFSEGILAGLSTIAVNTHLEYATSVGDHLQGLKAWQEDIAPGSTSLGTLAGVPLQASLIAGMAAYGQRMYENSSLGVIEAGVRAAEKKHLFFDKGPKAARLGRHGARAGIISAALMLPFALAAAAGDTSEELKKMYSGEKEVAIRKDRWWLTGATPYEGKKISYFDTHWYAQQMKGVKTKSLYGDQKTEDALNIFLHPFDWLRDPYQLEKMHVEDRPYPVWGMDLSAGSFFGKAFEKTIGRFLKPDVFNPRLAEELRYVAEEGGSSGKGLALLKEQNLPTASGTGGLVSTNEYSLAVPVSQTEADLIKEGIMKPPESPVYAPGAAALRYTKEAASDFGGLYGWLVGLGIDDALGFELSKPDLAFARSGEMTNAARAFRQLNIGGAFGLTEPQRRLLPTSNQIIEKRANPLKNLMPSWLPGDESEFHINFSRGDPYALVQHGDSRLPGQGYAALNPVLEGISPEDYPLIHKYKILSGVAAGSAEHYRVKNIVERQYAAGTLSEDEEGIFRTIKEQEIDKSQTKKFFHKRTTKDLVGMSLGERGLAKLWDTVAFNSETPLDNLTFFRPGGSLLHHRTAIDDYKKTQIIATDMSIWTNPYSHFIKPTANSLVAMVSDSFIPEETQRKRNVNEYFDQLEYVKYRQLYKQALSEGDKKTANTYKASYQKTSSGILTSGVDDSHELLRAFIALPKSEKPYFSAFIQADEEDRTKIQSMLPKRLASLYSTLWDRKDLTERIIAEGGNAEQISYALHAQSAAEDRKLESDNTEQFQAYEAEVKNKRDTSFREFLADSEAILDIEAKTGMPSKDFIGWDPRINLDEVKLRTLSVGEEDVHDFGFWQQDISEMERYTAILEDQEVTQSIDSIAEDIARKRRLEDGMMAQMHRKGYNVNYIRVTDGANSITMNMEYDDI